MVRSSRTRLSRRYVKTSGRRTSGRRTKNKRRQLKRGGTSGRRTKNKRKLLKRGGTLTELSMVYTEFNEYFLNKNILSNVTLVDTLEQMVTQLGEMVTPEAKENVIKIMKLVLKEHIKEDPESYNINTLANGIYTYISEKKKLPSLVKRMTDNFNLIQSFYTTKNFDGFEEYQSAKLKILKDISGIFGFDWQVILDKIFNEEFKDRNGVIKKKKGWSENMDELVQYLLDADAGTESTFKYLMNKCVDTYISDPFTLGRFLVAQNEGIKNPPFDRVGKTYRYAKVNMETNHKKDGHWIWYCFPQLMLEKTGRSGTSKYFYIYSVDEAVEYLRNPILRDRYIELANLVLDALVNAVSHGYERIDALYYVMNCRQDLGDDVQKLHESVSLFYLVAKQLGNDKILKDLNRILRYYEGGFFNSDSNDDNVHIEVKEKYDELLPNSELMIGSQPGLESAGTGSDTSVGPQSDVEGPASEADGFVHSDDTGIVPGTRQEGVGFENPGVQCYFVTVIQCLTNIAEFRQKIIQTLRGLDKPDNTFIYYLNQIINRKAQQGVKGYYLFKGNGSTKSPLWFIKNKFNGMFHPDVIIRAQQQFSLYTDQEDATDFFQFLIECIDIELFGRTPSASESLFGNLTNFTIISENECIDNPIMGNTYKRETATTIQLPLKRGKLNIQELLKTYMSSTIEYRDNMSDAEGIECGIRLKKSYSIRDLSGLFIITLKRWRQRFEDDTIDPIKAELYSKNVKIPQTRLIRNALHHHGGDVEKVINSFYTGEYMEYDEVPFTQYKDQREVNIDPEIIINGKKYVLISVVYQTGPSDRFGHYYCDCLNDDDSMWYRYNDKRVTIVGHPNNQDQNKQFVYMLFYRDMGPAEEVVGLPVGAPPPEALPPGEPSSEGVSELGEINKQIKKLKEQIKGYEGTIGMLSELGEDTSTVEVEIVEKRAKLESLRARQEELQQQAGPAPEAESGPAAAEPGPAAAEPGPVAAEPELEPELEPDQPPDQPPDTMSEDEILLERLRGRVNNLKQTNLALQGLQGAEEAIQDNINTIDSTNAQILEIENRLGQQPPQQVVPQAVVPQAGKKHIKVLFLDLDHTIIDHQNYNKRIEGIILNQKGILHAGYSTLEQQVVGGQSEQGGFGAQQQITVTNTKMPILLHHCTEDDNIKWFIVSSGNNVRPENSRYQMFRKNFNGLKIQFDNDYVDESGEGVKGSVGKRSFIERVLNKLERGHNKDGSKYIIDKVLFADDDDRHLDAVRRSEWVSSNGNGVKIETVTPFGPTSNGYPGQVHIDEYNGLEVTLLPNDFIDNIARELGIDPAEWNAANMDRRFLGQRQAAAAPAAPAAAAAAASYEAKINQLTTLFGISDADARAALTANGEDVSMAADRLAEGNTDAPAPAPAPPPAQVYHIDAYLAEIREGSNKKTPEKNYGIMISNITIKLTPKDNIGDTFEYVYNNMVITDPKSKRGMRWGSIPREQKKLEFDVYTDNWGTISEIKIILAFNTTLEASNFESNLKRIARIRGGNKIRSKRKNNKRRSRKKNTKRRISNRRISNRRVSNRRVSNRRYKRRSTKRRLSRKK